MFDISKLKLVGQVYSACAKFFGLGEDATESEIHEAIEGKTPLSEQLEAARMEAIAAQSEQLADLQAQLDAMKDDLAALRVDVEAKDARIADLQVEAAAHSTAIETAQKQHQKEVATLAGQISAIKAGKPTIQDEGGDTHEAATIKPGAAGHAAISSSALQSLIAKGRQN